MIDISVRIWTIGSSGFILEFWNSHNLCRKSCSRHYDLEELAITCYNFNGIKWPHWVKHRLNHWLSLSIETWITQSHIHQIAKHSQILFENAKHLLESSQTKTTIVTRFICFQIAVMPIQSLMVQDTGKSCLLVIIHIHYLLPIGRTLIQPKPWCSTKTPIWKVTWGPLRILMIWEDENVLLEIVPFSGDMLIFGGGG